MLGQCCTASRRGVVFVEGLGDSGVLAADVGERGPRSALLRRRVKQGGTAKTKVCCYMSGFGKGTGMPGNRDVFALL